MNLFLFGDTGFIGKNVCEHFQRISKIKIYKSSDFKINIMNRKAIDNAIRETMPDIVLNFSGMASIEPKDENVVYDINSFGFLNILESLKKHKFKGSIFHTSSSYVYQSSNGKLSEDSPTMPSTHYGCSKLLSEKFGFWFKNYFKVTVFRLFNIIGRKQKSHFFVPKIVKAFKEKDREITLGNLNLIRDFLDVRDFSLILEKIILGDNISLMEARGYEIFNLCSGKGVRLSEVINTLEKITGNRIIIKEKKAFTTKNGFSSVSQIGSSKNFFEKYNFQQNYSLKDTLCWMLEEKKIDEEQ